MYIWRNLNVIAKIVKAVKTVWTSWKEENKGAYFLRIFNCISSRERVMRGQVAVGKNLT